MKCLILLLLLVMVLAGCSTLNYYVGEQGVGLELEESNPKPIGFIVDTTSTKPFIKPLDSEDNQSWDLFD